MNILKKTGSAFSWLKNKINKQNRPVSAILSQLYIIILAFCVTYFTFRLLIMDQNRSTILFIRDNFKLFIISYLIIFVICEFFYLLTFVLYVPAVIVFPIVTIASVINVLKIEFRQEPFVFTDLLLVKESANIADKYPLNFGKYLPFLIPVFIVLLILPLFIKRVKLNWIKRVILGAASLIAAFCFFYFTLIPQNTFIEKTMTQTVWNLTTEYNANGFVLEFFESCKRSLMLAPKDYNKTMVQQYADDLGYVDKTIGPQDAADAMPPDEMPNVIVIMNESYWDSNNLTGIQLNQDPMASVRDIMAQDGNLSLLSPQFGGGTANVEYEFLTGKNIIYYPPGAMIYQQFVTKKEWSLAWYFRDIGYATTSIHPYYDWFWSRNTAYPLLGFENMYFNNGSLNYVDVKGEFISDKAVCNEIISRYKQFSENGDKPIFTFAVTMQNHGGYYPGRYTGADSQIKLNIGVDDAYTNGATETFFEGVRFASEAYVYLTDYFKDVKRPTYIIMFGDHAPSFANDRQFYAINENGDLNPADYYNMYRTPLVIWTNQDNSDVYQKLQKVNTISPSMLTEELFEITNLPKPGYIQMLANMKKSTNGFTSQYTLDANGNNIGKNPANADSSEIKDIFNKLGVVQYDATLGKNYVVNELNN
ncbi:MAG: sulfatase-like hydrolase/transferase [Oscillospiraceae bacterium]|nr:sulfatase-like hydrolase/transferase [Oscillospiraceae bacterium]